MGTRDVETFRAAGRTLFSLGLVKDAEGNLSVFDGERLVITRTGSHLADLTATDVLDGTLEAPPVAASSDLGVHLSWYREHGRGAIAHAHPPGSVPEGTMAGGEHGSYAFAETLQDAVAQIVHEVRGR